MIVYLDASALVKRYVAEAGSDKVAHLVGEADAVATSVLSRAEVAAALAKSIRVASLSSDEAFAALQVFRREWLDFVRLQVTESLGARADSLAWEYGLRGFDAMHLAAALTWQETLGERVTLATFDRRLWEGGRRAGLTVWPEEVVR